MKKYLVHISTLMMIFLLLFTVACASTPPASEAPKNQEQPKAEAPKSEPAQAGGKLKIGYICQQLTNPWFVQEEYGIKKRIAELDLDYFVVDANFNDERCLQGVDQVISNNCDALILNVTNTSLGPVIVKKLKEANIPFITVDDPLVDEAGKGQPHCGFSSYDSGVQGGKYLAEKAKAQGFFDSANTLKVMCLDMPGYPDIHQRIVGYQDGIKSVYPEIKDEQFIIVDCKDGMYEASLAPSAATLNANPDATHWLVVGLNDDAPSAALKVFEEAKFDFSKALFSGIGGTNLTLDVYLKGGDPAKSFLQVCVPAHIEGEMSVDLLYNYITKGTPIPDFSPVPGVDVDFDTYGTYFVNDKMPHEQ